MNNRIKVVVLSFTIFLSTMTNLYCQEVVMPYINYGFSGNRFVPIQISDAEYTLRIWINNSTSIDRVITILKNKDEDPVSYFSEIGFMESTDSLNHSINNQFVNIKEIPPKSGIEKFMFKLDSLQIMEYPASQDSFNFVFHQPFSRFIVELKRNDKYKYFSFCTFYPGEGEVEKRYSELELLIWEEYDINFHFSK